MMYPNKTRVRFGASTGTVLASAQRVNSKGHAYGPTFCWVEWDDREAPAGGDTIDETLLEPLEPDHAWGGTPEPLVLAQPLPRLFDSIGDAINAPGLVYAHWKGGIYRLLTLVKAPAALPDTLPLKETWEGPRPAGDLVVYEHLWPHAHQYYVRSAAEFFDHEARSPQGMLTRENRRFTPYEGGSVAQARLRGEQDHGELLRRQGL